MPRNFASFTTSIYRDDDFRALTISQQGVYFMLGLQPDITAVGVLTIALGRWAAKAAGMTREALNDELRVLQDRGHVAIDDATEELLIVKFAKWDRGWANRLRRPVLMAAVKAIESVHIRDIAVDELRKIALSDAVSAEEKQAKEALSDALSTLDRFPVPLGDHSREPETSIHEGEPSPIAAVAALPPTMFCPKHPNGTEKPCGPCGDARKRYAEWTQNKLAGEIERRRSADAAKTAAIIAEAADAKARAVPRPSNLEIVPGVGA